MENTVLMQGNSKEISTDVKGNNWVAHVGKNQITISQKQYDTIVRADKQGNIKMVHFKDFSINLAFITHMEKIKRSESYHSYDDPFVNEKPDPEGLKKIAEMKKKMLNKLPIAN